MSIAFGYYRRAKIYETTITFHDPLELIIRDNSRVHIRPESDPVLVYRGNDDDVLEVSMAACFHVAKQKVFYFEPSSPTRCYIATFIPDEQQESQIALERELLADGFVFKSVVSSHYFLRSVEELRPKLQTISSVSLIGLVPDRIIEEIQQCQNIKKLFLDLSVKYGDKILGAEIRELIRKMPWLEKIHICDMSYHHNVETLDVFEGLPKSVTLSGNLKFGRCLERWTHVEHLELHDLYDLMCSSSTFFQNFTALQSLTLSMPHLTTMSTLSTLSRTVTELTIQRPRNIDRQTCVAIGRLLRRNQLKKLVLQQSETVTKHDFLYVLLPLLEGSNTSLEELDITGTFISTHTMYFLEDIVHFCPTIRSIRGLDWSEWMQNCAQRRNTYAAVKPALQSLLDTARPGSFFTRALELTLAQVRTSMPVYHRSNRKWYRTGYREIASTPLKLL